MNSTTHHNPSLHALDTAEALILRRLGGRPWAGPDPSGVGLTEARAAYAALRKAAGYKCTSDFRWLTTESSKFQKGLQAGGVTVFAGLTLHAARGGARVWKRLDTSTQAAIAGALGCAMTDINTALRATLCPYATPACTIGCVVEYSHRATASTTELTRLLRQLLVLFNPRAAFELTYEHLSQLIDKHGLEHVRWRTNVGDDVRWELLAPPLFREGLRAYAYSKHSVASRPESGDLRIVRSASERWSPEDVVDECASGGTVAVVLDLPKHAPLPTTWHGVQVIDGDVTDDLSAHPHGVVVGLRVKGPTKKLRRQLADMGFARNPNSNTLSK